MSVSGSRGEVILYQDALLGVSPLHFFVVKNAFPTYPNSV